MKSVFVSLAAAAAALLAVGQAMGQLGYVECSTGFQNNPAMEGGRTELEFADINNDGNVDILSIGDHGNPYVNTDEHGVMVWFGDGHGGWGVFQYGDFGYGGIAIGDVNWDGKWDIGYGMHHNYSGEDLGDDMMEVALGDGTGQMWTAWDDSLVPGGSVWGMFSTDFADIDNGKFRGKFRGHNKRFWMRVHLTRPARNDRMVETMLKLHVKSRTLTADSLRLAASDGCSTRNTPEPLAVSREPMALPDALVYELYGLTEEEVTIVEKGSQT